MKNSKLTKSLFIFTLAILSSINAAGGSPDEDLLISAISGNFDGIKKALKEGANINTMTEYGGLPAGIKQGDNWSYTTYKGVNANETALKLAAREGYLEIVKYLIEKGAKIDIQDLPDKETALMNASEKGYSEIVKLLLEKKANPDLNNSDGKTAYDLAKNDEIRALLTSNMKK